MSSSLRLTKDDNSSVVDKNLSRIIIGGLLYLTTSKPNICFNVGVCARYQ